MKNGFANQTRVRHGAFGSQTLSRWIPLILGFQGPSRIYGTTQAATRPNTSFYSRRTARCSFDTSPWTATTPWSRARSSCDGELRTAIIIESRSVQRHRPAPSSAIGLWNSWLLRDWSALGWVERLPSAAWMEDEAALLKIDCGAASKRLDL